MLLKAERMRREFYRPAMSSRQVVSWEPPVDILETAREVGADAILMGKNGVDGVYDGDPQEDPGARFLPELTHLEAIERGLKVMDTTALTLCMDNGLPIYVFGLDDERTIERVVAGERVGTIISTPREDA